MKKIYIDWEDFGIMVDKLVKKIKDSGEKFSGVYGIPRGGLPLAVCLSHKLDIPLSINSVLGNVLVCDDISDTGETLFPYSNKIATLFSTPWTKTKPDWYVEEKVNKDSWIIYPWEVDEMEEERQTTLDEFE